MHSSARPLPAGLYDPRYEHDACGVGFVADLNGTPSRGIVDKGMEILVNLDHRGATGAEPNTGDGAGILVQLPEAFLRREAALGEIALPPGPGGFAVGQMFLPRPAIQAAGCRTIFETALRDCGLEPLGWRTVPVADADLGATARREEPLIQQLFVARPRGLDETAFERRLFVARKYGTRQVWESGHDTQGLFYVCSMSSRTIVYKGMLRTTQVAVYFPDLCDPLFVSALALVHSRFSTNTHPSWKLAHPFRTLAHNGEINTLRGNINWMRSREAILSSSLFTPDEIERIKPVVVDSSSDSAMLDNAVELLMMGGRSIPHVMMMIIPEAWEKDPEMDPDRRAFYEYHATLLEPWDGPASVAFTDGRIIGATLDRNGLRPSRFCLTRDNILVMASEAGVLDFAPEDVVLKGRLQPGRMFIASLDEHRIIPDEEIKARICSQKPYAAWLREAKVTLSDLPESVREIHQPDAERVKVRQKVFGYTLEDLRILMEPMVNDAEEAIGSMGNDAALPVLSRKSRLLPDYFHQLFAQVTNPPIDAIREEIVMSVTSFVGNEGNLLDSDHANCRMIELDHPVLTNQELERLRWVDRPSFQCKTINTVFRAQEGSRRLRKALDRIRRDAEEAIDEGYNILVLSDRPVDSGHAPIPPMLAVAAVHHHLIRKGLRSQCGIIIETGEAREVHHFACLLGYGASAVNPYLAFDTIEDMRVRRMLRDDLTTEACRANFQKAVKKGLLKVMSKMGISTLQSYIGAQIFEAVGLGQDIIDECFHSTPSRLGGIDLDTLERESLLRHRFAFPHASVRDDEDLEVGGLYQWRLRGERHLLSPDVVSQLQQSCRNNDYAAFRRYTALLDAPSPDPVTLRALLDFVPGTPVPLDEVEPVDSIVRRFASGAMSFGSISWEAHTTLAIAMNRLGARSNTGEGGEDPSRFVPLENGDSMRSAIKQVASGRFGVTSEYLVNADELQIKMAQGAKPGEGGQIPGHKVDAWIGRVRHSTPGVGLISPPPHHDIYSIEDLAQLIHDLKNANTRARVSVKLVAEVGVGTVAAGVAKAHADHILISGWDGGTGASPLTSIKHAGLPWELGLAESHQVLMRNRLRDRVVLQTDGQLRTGRDLAIATLLGAEEWGVATGALLVMGCIMMRKCHLNTCPVGIATQHPELRKLFSGEADHVVRFFRFLAQELREIMAQLGFRTVEEMVGRSDRLAPRREIDHWKARHLDLDRLLHRLDAPEMGKSFCCNVQDHGLDKALDNRLLELCAPAVEGCGKVRQELSIRNVNRTVGTMLSSEITRRHGAKGLPDGAIHIKFTGSGGQSFFAFGVPGVTMELEGETNDYLGKGLSGGRIILYPPRSSTFDPRTNVICGNVSFYGATSGEAFLYGMAGERFCVRNSGARVVVESVGDHGCEYMTGGRVVILGPIGRNFAAGMSGGVAYLLDLDASPCRRVNPELVELDAIDSHEESAEVRKLVEDHARLTGSITACELVADWSASVHRFTRVMPRDYRRALAEMAQSTTQAAEVR